MSEKIIFENDKDKTMYMVESIGEIVGYDYLVDILKKTTQCLIQANQNKRNS